MPRTRSPLPAALARAAAQFDAWRGKRTKRGYPPGLWQMAGGLAGLHGVSATARALGLDYYCLARRVRDPAAQGSGVGEPAFVEIVPGHRVAPGECVVEVENGDGAKMRVRLTGESVAQVVAIERAFLEGRA